jgi:hypothetical protein
VFSRLIRIFWIATAVVLRSAEEDPRLRIISGLLMGAVAAVLATAAVLAAMAGHTSSDAAPQRDIPAAVEAGTVCTSLSDRRYEVSCGTTAFGDLRFNCTKGVLGNCPRTTAVSLRNIGRNPVKVAMVSGRHEGDRRISPASEVTPGQTVTLSMRPEENFLFDILLGSVKSGAGSVQVVSVA